jgi:hypothetical protein
VREFFFGWGFVAAKVGLITLVFSFAMAHLARELRFIRELTDFLGYLVIDGDGRTRPPASLRLDELRDQVQKVVDATDPAYVQRQVRGWQMRAQRLEPALGFWVDLLRQLGLLGTVIALAMSMAIERTDVTAMIAPLGLAVWTTVAGLAYSIWLSAQFGMKMTAWTDACEKNIEAWEAHRKRGGGAP